MGQRLIPVNIRQWFQVEFQLGFNWRRRLWRLLNSFREGRICKMNSLLLGNRFEKLNKYCSSKYRCSSQTHHSFRTHPGATPPHKRDEREKKPHKISCNRSHHRKSDNFLNKIWISIVCLPASVDIGWRCDARARIICSSWWTCFPSPFESPLEQRQSS